MRPRPEHHPDHRQAVTPSGRSAQQPPPPSSPPTAHDRQRRLPARTWTLWGAFTFSAACLAFLLSGGGACQPQSGMFCVASSDCPIGMVCSKSPSATDGYGICEPVRRSLGEACQHSSDCQVGLLCSTARTGDTSAALHGVCEAVLDAGAGPAGDGGSGGTDGG